MSKIPEYRGYLNFTTLEKMYKAAHDSFVRSKSDNDIVKIVIWKNDEPDKYGNNLSVQFDVPKDSVSEKLTFGYLKNNYKSAVNPTVLPKLEGNDLPF